MKLTDLFLAELESEAAVTRPALERVPEGRNDWKPHPKSMPLGALAALVASMPSWVAMTVDADHLDLGNGENAQKAVATRADLLRLFDGSVAAARASLAKTTDAHLMLPWRLLAGGHVVLEQPRHEVLRASVFNHLAHHRGQLTVYLRLNDAPVPAIYGPTADEGGFGA